MRENSTPARWSIGQRPRGDVPALIGMVHVLALPGSPRFGGDMQAILDAAKTDTERLIEGGCDAIIVENMHDLPYLNRNVGPETVAAMTLAVAAVTAFGHPTGVQVLAGANREALGICVATGASFIRAEGFAYAHVADEGWMDACAGELIRTRAHLGSDVQVWADIKKKHSAHAVTHDLSIADVAHGSAFSGADAVIVTGAATGAPTAPDDVQAAKDGGLPVLVGSGVNAETAHMFVGLADGLIVGSAIKEDGDWTRPVDVRRVAALRRAIDVAGEKKA